MIARHLDSQTDGEFNYSCPLQVVEYGKAGLLFKPFLVPSKTCSCVCVRRRSVLMCARARVVCFLGSCGCCFVFVLFWVVFHMFVYTCTHICVGEQLHTLVHVYAYAYV